MANEAGVRELALAVGARRQRRNLSRITQDDELTPCHDGRAWHRPRGRAVSPRMLHPQNRCSGKARHRREKYHNGPPISSVSLRMEKEVVDRPPCREGWASSAATTSAQSVRMRCSRRRGGHDQNPATSPVPVPYGVYGTDLRRERRKQSKATFEVPARSGKQCGERSETSLAGCRSQA